MGKLLISGNGRIYYITVILDIIAFLIAIIGGIYILVLVESSFGSQYPELKRLLGKSNNETMFIALGIFLIIFGLAIIFPLMRFLCMAKTEINVYENEIRGEAVTKVFSVQSFNLKYEQISNVDIVKKSAVIIYTPYAKYTCYVSNPNEIQTAILKIKENLV